MDSTLGKVLAGLAVAASLLVAAGLPLDYSSFV